MQQIKNILKRTLYVLDKPQKILCIFVFLLTCIGAAFECLGVSAIIPLVSAVQDPALIMNSAFFKSHPSLSALTYNEVIGIIGAGVILLYIAKNLYFIFMSWIRVKFSGKIGREISVKLFASYLSRGYEFFLNINYGQFCRGVVGDTSAVSSVIFSIFSLVAEILTIACICIFMFFADWSIALVVLVLAIVCVLLIFFLFRKKMFEAGVEARKYSIKIDQALAQSFLGVKDVLLLRKQKHFIGEYERNKIEVQKLECKQTVAKESPSYIIEGICVSGLMFAVCVRIILKGTDPHFIAVLAAFAVGAFRVLPSLGRISSALNTLTGLLPSIDALYEHVLQREAYVREHPEASFIAADKKLKWEIISKDAQYSNDDTLGEGREYAPNEDKFHTSLELRNISFRYSEELGYVLRNVNLTIKKGQAIALIGTSGAGKSTLADILLGLLIPQEGGVYMDGDKITDIPERWAATIGYVPQSVFLADISIRENVAFGERVENIDDDRVREALERAELKEFIDTLPDGMETAVGDRGVRLSGGQRQRIAIARALYHRPEILVLDEATSALDNETETAIMSAIDSLQGQVTMIIVAHRLTTVKNCDVIYEVNQTGLHIRDKNEVLSGV